MTDALDLWGLVLLPSRALWQEILRDTIPMVLHGDGTSDFRFGALLSLKYRVLLISQEVQKPKSEEQFVVQ